MNGKAKNLAAHVVDQMNDDDKADFRANPESWRDGLDTTYTVNVSTGEQECSVDDLMDAMLELLND